MIQKLPHLTELLSLEFHSNITRNAQCRHSVSVNVANLYQVVTLRPAFTKDRHIIPWHINRYITGHRCTATCHSCRSQRRRRIKDFLSDIIIIIQRYLSGKRERKSFAAALSSIVAVIVRFPTVIFKFIEVDG